MVPDGPKLLASSPSPRFEQELGKDRGLISFQPSCGKSVVSRVCILAYCVLFNTMSRLIIAFLPRSKCLLISWLLSPSAVILEPRKINSAEVRTGRRTCAGGQVAGALLGSGTPSAVRQTEAAAAAPSGVSRVCAGARAGGPRGPQAPAALGGERRPPRSQPWAPGLLSSKQGWGGRRPGACSSPHSPRSFST